LRNYPWPKYSPLPPKQINKKERILIINQAPRPPHVKPPPKKKKFEIQFKESKQTEKKSCSAWKFLLVNTIVIFAQFAKQV
jgi:hypothetical protein